MVFAIDSAETAELIDKFNGKYFMTSESCSSGTERLVEIYNKKLIQADIWVNWQGDEPFINTEMIGDLLQTAAGGASDIWTLKKKITTKREIDSPQIAKVICDSEGYALYFSNSIPHYRDDCLEEDKVLLNTWEYMLILRKHFKKFLNYHWHVIWKMLKNLSN